MGLQGFREYREDYQGQWTPDSGPIIGGLGVAATGLGIKAAASVKDDEAFDALFTGMNRTMKALEVMDHVPGSRRSPVSAPTSCRAPSTLLRSLVSKPQDRGKSTLKLHYWRHDDQKPFTKSQDKNMIIIGLALYVYVAMFGPR